MTDLDRALDDLDESERRALACAAAEKRDSAVSNAHPRWAAFWSAVAVAAAESEARHSATLSALEREFDPPGFVTFGED